MGPRSLKQRGEKAERFCWQRGAWFDSTSGKVRLNPAKVDSLPNMESERRRTAARLLSDAYLSGISFECCSLRQIGVYVCGHILTSRWLHLLVISLHSSVGRTSAQYAEGQRFESACGRKGAEPTVPDQKDRETMRTSWELDCDRRLDTIIREQKDVMLFAVPAHIGAW